MKDNDKIDKILKKHLKLDPINKDRTIDDPFLLAAIGIEIEEDLGIDLPDDEFMKAKTIGDIKRIAKNGNK
ncbi:MAG: acyl carrier protein [Nanoarchaeota archaeon]